MAKIRHMYSGGNTCYGFYSFYDYIVSPDVERKIIFKGGPGVGKSSIMKKLGQTFAEKGWDIEYHWCSSDNNSLDGLVIGNQQYCFLDGTTPHTVDPSYPGAVDEIINLGKFWNRTKIAAHRQKVIELTQCIASCFNRAYNRLQETNLAYKEWKLYNEEAQDKKTISRNILALADDFLGDAKVSSRKPRHLFAGAITPQGLVSKIDTVIDPEYALFIVKGDPGTGQNDLFNHVLNLIELKNAYAEVYHNPFDPNEIDIIMLPDSRAVLINTSSQFFYYAKGLHASNFKRLLDFNQLVKPTVIESYAKLIFNARDRFDSGIKEAISFIQTAKEYHDELESYYIPAMDFEAIEKLKDRLVDEILRNSE